MFPLVASDAVKHMPQVVFFTGEVDKLPCQDSSIRCHDTAYCIRVKAKVNSTNALFRNFCIRKGNLFRKGKAQIVFPAPLFQCRSRWLTVLPVALEIPNIRSAQSDLYPNPVVTIVEFQICGIRVFGNAIHFFVIESRHSKPFYLKFGFFTLLAALLPVVVVRVVAADTAKSLLNCSSAQIGGHLVKMNIKIIFGNVVFCPMHKMFCCIEPCFCLLDGRKSFPLGIKNSSQKRECVPVQSNRISEDAVFTKNLNFVT